MAVTLPIVGDSEGVWGTVLNTAITDIDDRTVANTNAIGNPYSNANSLDTRVGSLESRTGPIVFCTSATLPALAPGQMTFETDTGYMSIVLTIGGVDTRVPWPGSIMCKLRQTTVQSFAPSTNVAISFQVADTNRMGGWSAGTSTDFKAPVAGVYELTGGVSFEGNIVGYRRTEWYIGASFILGSASSVGPCQGSVPLVTCVVARPTVVTLAKNQIVQLAGAQNAGTGVTLSSDVTNLYQSSMTVRYLGVG